MFDVPIPSVIKPDLAAARGLSHHFGTGDTRTRILTDINMSVPAGQLIIMTGPSGSGKTTLLTLFGALRSGQSGTLRVLDQDLIGLKDDALVALRRNIGFIFQLHNLLESLSAIDNVMMAAQLGARPIGDARARAVYLLERVGLSQRMHHKPSALSGGQRQRVAVVRALVNAPRLILADEPTAALDMASSLQVIDLLQENIAQSHCSCLMVTHDNRILDRADRIVSLVDGRIVSDVLVREQVVICEMLSGMDVFKGLGAAALSRVAEAMQPRPFKAGDVLVRQGETGEHFFLLRAGEVDVHVADTSGSKIVNTLDSGAYFGERALITGDVRNATIIARGEGLAYALDKAAFHAALDTVPSLQNQLRTLYFARQ